MIIFAHRGASSLAPENTLAAFELAIEAQADGIELDIFQIDNELFVFHDRLLKRLTGRSGYITELNSMEIRQLRINNPKPSTAFKEQLLYSIPTLTEALRLINGRCLVNIELKNKVDTDLLLAHLKQAEKAFNFQPGQFIISAFYHPYLQAFQQEAPHYAIGALTSSCPLNYAEFAVELRATSIHIDIEVLTEAFVQDALARHLKLYVFTVDDGMDILWLKKIGVTGIFTNHPAYARTVLSEL